MTDTDTISNDSARELDSRPDDAANRLGTEGIGKLLLRFSIPAIVGMLVNAIYNVVDRLFVGRGVNEIALGGLSLVMPLMTITLALSMLFGVGAANMISMRLGQNRREEAENALNHCFWANIVFGAATMALQFIFLDPLLSILGAQEGSEALVYAKNYYWIVLLGQVFLMVGFSFSHCTRAQGFPVISMISMFIGAGVNFVLDPLFIFGFHWGVEGAAWATIIAQFVQMVWMLSFNFSKKAVIRLRLRTFKPSLRILGQIAVFGSSQFCLQFIMSAVQLIYNSVISRAGVEAMGAASGGDIALSAVSIQGTFVMLVIMPIFGINQGAQPILGFNYGAGKFRRVLKAYLSAVAVASVWSVLGFMMTQTLSRQLVGLFAPDGSDTLMRLASMALRIATLMLPLVGFQIVSTNFFAVTGRPKMSIILSLMRQCIVLIPCLLIFSRLWGLEGTLAAMPVADGTAIIFTGIMVFFEIKKLRSSIAAERMAGAT
ncbi:MAG: MATE family efflux transporter [Treponema sp.]|jgi:putative MATE family efflux protein|nr:MATE family efflux transporter [Treponema sp.]